MEAFLNKTKNTIDKQLEQFFAQRMREVSKIDPKAETLMKASGEFVLNGGKRLRPALVIASYLCFREEKEEVQDIALSLELIHAFLLIHDDIIDDDDIRRGKPTVHKVFENIYEKRYRNEFTKRNKKEFGCAMAILAGDTLYSLANQIITHSSFPQKVKIKVITKVNQTVHRVVYGELLDIFLERKRIPSEEELMLVMNLKTASYTMETPLHIGALLANAPKEEFKRLSSYSTHLGQAFQIKDDILAIFGNQDTFGKKIGNDITEGKKTILITRTINKLKGKEKQYFSSRIGKNISHSEFKKIQALIVSSGALDDCNALVDQLVKKAKSRISSAPYRREGKKLLLGLADYMATRQK